jgi:hypothetical protein
LSIVPLLSGLYQIAYVTSDLEAGTRQLAAIHGIDRFRVKHDVPSSPGMPEMVLHQAHVFIGSVQIELIQPAAATSAAYFSFGDSLRERHPVLGAVAGHITDLETIVGRQVNRSTRLDK